MLYTSQHTGLLYAYDTYLRIHIRKVNNTLLHTHTHTHSSELNLCTQTEITEIYSDVRI